jgi:hypothetical protein
MPLYPLFPASARIFYKRRPDKTHRSRDKKAEKGARRREGAERFIAENVWIRRAFCGDEGKDPADSREDCYT